MRLIICLFVVTISLGLEPANADEPTTIPPVECFRKVSAPGLTVGQAVELCSGTTDANKTVRCFEMAWEHPGRGGLGLTLGQAIRLCKPNSTQQ